MVWEYVYLTAQIKGISPHCFLRCHHPWCWVHGIFPTAGSVMGNGYRGLETSIVDRMELELETVFPKSKAGKSPSIREEQFVPDTKE